MLKQTTLDGKTFEGELTDFEVRLLIKRVDEIAKTNPKYFAELCAYEGAAYHGERGKPTPIRLLKCYSELQEVFGFFTENMVNALMAYPIED